MTDSRLAIVETCSGGDQTWQMQGAAAGGVRTLGECCHMLTHNQGHAASMPARDTNTVCPAARLHQHVGSADGQQYAAVQWLGCWCAAVNVSAQGFQRSHAAAGLDNSE